MVLATLRDLIEDERGTTSIEYALIAAVVSVVGILAFGAMGRDLVVVFGEVEAAMADPPGP